ncbi:hypothetical protein DFH28DRAFT_1077420 [Melampsora americana]|nr:hypothetical protein DFH28DRAFT_1077420 [Melampsora americana]
MATDQRSLKTIMESGDRKPYTSPPLTTHHSFLPRQKKFCCCRDLELERVSNSSQSDCLSTSASDESWTSKFSFDRNSCLSTSTNNTSQHLTSSRKYGPSKGFPSVTLNESVEENGLESEFRFSQNDNTSNDDTQEEWDHEDQEDDFSISSFQESSLQVERKDFEMERSKFLVDHQSIQSDSLVFNHLKELLLELKIADNQSSEYHVSWAFESRFCKPKPSERFKSILIEMNEIERTGEMMGNDLNHRIQTLRLENQDRDGYCKSFPLQFGNLMINSNDSKWRELKPPWKVFGPVKALNSVTFLTVQRI